MSKFWIVLLLLLFSLAMFVGAVAIFTAHDSSLVTLQIRIRSVGELAGYLVVVFAALAMLISILEGKGMKSLFYCLFPMLGGIMMVSFHWIHPLAIIILAVTMLILEFIRGILDRKTAAGSTVEIKEVPAQPTP